MTDDRILQRNVTTVLTSVAPTREPAGLLDLVLATSSHTRQRPRWLVSSKERPMRLGANVAFGSPIARLAYLIVLLITLLAVTAGSVAVGASLLSSPSPAIVVPAEYPPGPGTFRAGPDMAEPRAAQAVRLLDGSILFLGGATTERWDPATKTFHPSAPMPERIGGPAVLLHDGRVLVVGGQQFSEEPGGGPRSAAAQIWDPTTETWSPTGSMATPRDAAAVVLGDGRVLMVGGVAEDGTLVPVAEVWDPDTGKFLPAGTLPAGMDGGMLTLLEDGRVVVIDGSHAVVWDPDTETFTEADRLSHPRLWSFSIVLADGRILVIGGPVTLGGSPVRNAEVWDPRTRAFTDAGTMTVGRTNHPSLTLLPDGRVLVAGGSLVWDAAPVRSVEIWDPTTATFSEGAFLSEGRAAHAASLLDDGTVLIAGGYTGDLYNPSFPTTTEIWCLAQAPDPCLAQPSGVVPKRTTPVARWYGSTGTSRWVFGAFRHRHDTERMGHPRGTTVRSTRCDVRKQAGFLRQVGAAVLAAATVLMIAVPASADGDRPRDRDLGRDQASGPLGVQWTSVGPDQLGGVEWTGVRLFEPGGVEWTGLD